MESEEGRGTAMSPCTYPLTLAILDGMKVMVGGFHVYHTHQDHSGIPGAEAAPDYHRPGRERDDHDPGGMLSGHPPARYFLHRSPRLVLQTASWSWWRAKERAACLFADKLLGEQQAVVKPMPAYITRELGRLKGIGGMHHPGGRVNRAGAGCEQPSWYKKAAL